MINTAVIEDNGADQKTIKGFFEQYIKEKKADLSLSIFADAESFLEKFSADKYDLILMDINLTGMNGLEAAARLRAIDQNVVLVFMTNLAQYAIDGYKFNAFDYMVKPISYWDFSERLFKALQHVGNRKKTKVLIFENGKKVIMPLARIYYVEVCDHLLVYHTKDGCFRAYGALKELTKELNGSGFALCNSCFLVNLAYVTTVEGFNVNVGGDNLLISHPKRKIFLQELNEYLGG
jgi:DNA-binding LytR/AlgR family response regulator